MLQHQVQTRLDKEQRQQVETCRAGEVHQQAGKDAHGALGSQLQLEKE